MVTTKRTARKTTRTVRRTGRKVARAKRSTGGKMARAVRKTGQTLADAVEWSDHNSECDGCGQRVSEPADCRDWRSYLHV